MPDTKEPRNLESLITRLEGIVEELEKGGDDLDKQLELFEKGVRLSRQCIQSLEAIEKKVEQLSLDSNGNLTTSDFELTDAPEKK